MTSIQKAQLEFLNETVEFFNYGNRCVNYNGVCFYHREGKPGCAIGRKISTELAKKLDSYIGPKGGNGVDNDFVFKSLPESLRELGQDFLSAIQGLHDEEMAWDNEGLTEYGHSNVSNMKTKFGLR